MYIIGCNNLVSFPSGICVFLVLKHMPKSTIKSLQFIQNYAVKMVCTKQKYDSSTECLCKLHWLAIHNRCIYRLMTIMYKTLDEQELQYLFDKLSFKISKMMNRQSSSNIKQLVVPFNIKEQRVTEVLVSLDQVIGTNYQII